MGLADWTRVLLLSLIWGSSFFYIEIALREAGPFTIVFVRTTVAALALHLYVRARRQTIVYTPKRVTSFLAMGILANAIPFSLIALGQTRIESGLAAIFIATTPLFTVTVAHLWGRAEHATPAKIGGVLMGLAGVAILMGSDVLTGVSGIELGQLAMLGAAFSYATSAVYGRRYRELPAAAVAASMLTAGSICSAPLAFFFETPFAPVPSAVPLAAMAALALLSTAFAYILYFKILASAGATNAMLVTLVQPSVAILLGVAFLGETLALRHFGGLAFILLGLALVDGRIVRLITVRKRATTP